MIPCKWLKHRRSHEIGITILGCCEHTREQNQTRYLSTSQRLTSNVATRTLRMFSSNNAFIVSFFCRKVAHALLLASWYVSLWSVGSRHSAVFFDGVSLNPSSLSVVLFILSSSGQCK